MWKQIKTILLLGILSGLMLGAGYALGRETGLTLALLLAVGMNSVTYWYSDKIVLMMYRAKEAKKTEYPILHKMVEEIAKSAHIPKPRIFIIPTANPNAFATGRNEKKAVVACTEGILKILDDNELKGVLAHEISHIKNKDILVTTIAATIAAVISYIAMLARWGALFGSRDDRAGELFAVLALAILTPLIATILQLAISRSREYLADETGARLIKNPKALANALKKLHVGNKMYPIRGGNAATSSLFIVNPFSAKGLFTVFSTHPPLEKRVQKLESMRL